MTILRIIYILISIMEVTLELSDPVVMQSKHTMSYIPLNFCNWPSSCKKLIKYNNNNLEENDEKVKESINIELTYQKTDPYNDENAIDSKWSDVQEEDEEDIAMANFIESLQKQTYEEIFSKI